LVGQSVTAERRFASIESKKALLDQKKLLDERLGVLKDQVDETDALNTSINDTTKSLNQSLSPAEKLSLSFKDMATSAKKLEDSLTAVKDLLPKTEAEPKPATGNYTGRVYGRDNVNTLVAKDESIVNGANTKRFYSQLVAINGKPPTMVQPNTISIGDINVSLNSGGSATSDARAIATELKRLVKRGIA